MDSWSWNTCLKSKDWSKYSKSALRICMHFMECLKLNKRNLQVVTERILSLHHFCFIHAINARGWGSKIYGFSCDPLLKVRSSGSLLSPSKVILSRKKISLCTWWVGDPSVPFMVNECCYSNCYLFYKEAIISRLSLILSFCSLLCGCRISLLKSTMWLEA